MVGLVWFWGYGVVVVVVVIMVVVRVGVSNIRDREGNEGNECMGKYL